LRCSDPTLPTGSENLVVRAAERLKAETRCPHGATIELRKAIPAQAGLAGGSSDAGGDARCSGPALGPAPAPPDRLDAWPGRIGSDVAFFRHARHRLQSVAAGVTSGADPDEPGAPLRAGLSPFGLSTADVYRNLTPPERPRPLGPVLEALVAGRPEALGRKPVQPRFQPRRRSVSSPPWCG